MEPDFEPYICRDKNGNTLISLDNIEEMALFQSPLLTHCLAIVKVGEDYLFGWNKWRSRYEIFGGCVEKGLMRYNRTRLRKPHKHWGFADFVQTESKGNLAVD